jgi:hypothetical protein
MGKNNPSLAGAQVKLASRALALSLTYGGESGEQEEYLLKTRPTGSALQRR